MVQTYSQEFLNETRNNIQDSSLSPRSLHPFPTPVILAIQLFPEFICFHERTIYYRDIAVHTMVCKLMYREKCARYGKICLSYLRLYCRIAA